LQNLTTSSPLPHNLISCNFTTPAEGGRKKKLLPKTRSNASSQQQKNPINSLLATKQNSGKHAELATGGKRSDQPNGNSLAPTLGLGFRDQD
jgi:hypothetical protein